MTGIQRKPFICPEFASPFELHIELFCIKDEFGFWSIGKEFIEFNELEAMDVGHIIIVDELLTGIIEMLLLTLL